MHRPTRLLAALCVLASLTSAAAGERPRRILFLTHSAGFKHAVLPTAEKVFVEIGKRSGSYEGVVLEGHRQEPGAVDLSAITPEYLAGFDAVMFFTTGELPLDHSQKAALVDFVRSGKAWIGVHSATDTFYEWPEYGRLSGAYFKKHGPANREVVIAIEDPNHPATRMLGQSWRVTDEIYQFGTQSGDRRRPVPLSRENVHVLMSVDKKETDLASQKMTADGDYPLAWTLRYGEGRSFYTALGHREEVWEDPKFQEHLLGGIKWALGLEG